MDHKLRVLFYALLAVVLALIATGEQPSLADGSIIYVDADATGANNGASWSDAFTTLQPALDAAVSGDQIWIAAGIYIPTRECMIVVFTPGYECFQLKNGVAVYGGFDPSVGDISWQDRDWLSNQTILSGDLNGDDGPDFANTSDNCFHVFFHPSGTGLNSSAILDGFTISGGNAQGDYGGGMYNSNSSPTLTNIIFSANSASTDGGAMYNFASSPKLTNVTFAGNSAGSHGGGIYYIYSYSSQTLTNLKFIDNSAGGGGGLAISWSNLNLTNTIFTGNSASSGGGMWIWYESMPALTNVTFAENSAEIGGGIYVGYDSIPVLTNVTFYNNSSTLGGGGIYNFASSPKLTNGILWGNTPDEITNQDESSFPAVTYSIVQGGYPGEGNIDADPLFVDPDTGDFHLSPGSPCIDSGSNATAYLPAYDFEGDPRILDGDGDSIAIVDMGVDEASEAYQTAIIYVDLDATGAEDGSSWADAFTTLQPALNAAFSGDQIWVAQGTYFPTYLFDPLDPRSASFQMKNGVAIYGGFAGGETGLEQRDWVANLTILSGDLYGDDGPEFTNNGENSYHVFFHPEGAYLDSTAILDGFRISGGNASGGPPDNYGAGMYNEHSSPSLTGVTFTNNIADYGGGLYNYDSSPSLTDVTFSGNSARYSGGGMVDYNYSSSTLNQVTFSANSATYNGGGMDSNWYSSPNLTNVTFSGNTAANGGGMQNYHSNAALTNVTFSSNTAVTSGGGMFNLEYASPTLINVIFSDNSAALGGGMHNLSYSSPTLINTTLSGNMADTGGGMYNDQNSDPILMNTILWGNTSDQIFNGVGTPVVTFSDIQGGYAGEGNLDADPLFIDAANGDFHLSPGSPCIDTGSNAAPFLPEYDFEGDPRILDGDGDGIAIVDIGVDEAIKAHQPKVIYVDRDATGAQDGASWADAFTDLQPALNTAVSGDQIWVAEGTYLPTYLFDSLDPRSASFQMKNGVAIYGGFAGGETGLEQRDWVTNLTILSGDLGIIEDASDNSYHVFYHPEGTDLDTSAILDGFTIQGGYANIKDSQNTGGGMYNFASSPTLNNIIFSGNSAYISGGGISNYYSAPVLFDCTFLQNATIQGTGGGMFNHSSSPILTNISFIRNRSPIGGSGMYNLHSSSPVLTNCTFYDNVSSDSTVINVWSSPVLTNCILWDISFYEISNYESTTIVTYSDIKGGYPGEGNIDADPLFMDTANWDFHLSLHSPCIDSGTNATPYLPEYDFEGDPRILDGNDDGDAIVDMGADEFIYMLIEVIIDIKPSTLKNNIPLISRGSLPVAILTTAEFDATTIDSETVLFAGASPLSWAVKDIDEDGDLDLVLYFKILELVLDEYATEVTLTGVTFDGKLIQGTDSVIVLTR